MQRPFLTGAVENSPINLSEDRRRQHNIGTFAHRGGVTILHNQQFKSIQVRRIDKIARQQCCFRAFRQRCVRNTTRIRLDLDVVFRFHYLIGELLKDMAVLKGARCIADHHETIADKFL